MREFRFKVKSRDEFFNGNPINSIHYIADERETNQVSRSFSFAKVGVLEYEDSKHFTASAKTPLGATATDMKKISPLYIPLTILFVVALIAFVQHVSQISLQLNNFARSENSARLPFRRNGNAVVRPLPEAVAAGIREGDRVVGINGRVIDKEQIFYDELTKTREGEQIALAIERTENGAVKPFEANITAVKNGWWAVATRLGLWFVLSILIPIFCILLGFWVAFVRSRDALAWLLLGVLLGIAAFGMEGSNSVLLGIFRSFFLGSLALWMMLFGFYFPEQWSFDKRFPWAKWLLIVPLGVQLILAVLIAIQEGLGILFLEGMLSFARPFQGVVIIFNMVAIALFFVSLSIKSATLASPDSRRRLRLLTFGTGLAFTPSFLIMLSGLIFGIRGSFFDIAPEWLAITSLLAVFLFPLTMAYVIVVQRAMDASVVVRQGLQYALATNGVKILQFVLLFAVGLGTLWSIRNYGADVSRQIAFIIGGITLIPLVDFIARRLRIWIDRRFFREAYNAEQILSDLSEDVRTMVETKPLLETVSHKISESLHVPQIALLLKNGNGFQPAYALGYNDAPEMFFKETGVTIERLKRSESITIYADDAENWINREPNLDGERENLHELNSQLLLPVGVKEKLSGFISLSPKKSEAPYTANDLRLLRSVASQTGLALENSRLTEAIASEAAQRERLNREVEIAREVQERLFPQDLPPVKNLDYFGGCRPALGVGGDYYDFFELENGTFGIAIGDVSGKGIGASLMMASLQASLRGQAIHAEMNLAELMSNVNKLVYETSTSNRYATFFYAQFDPITKKLGYVNAGHNPPFLFRKTANDYELIRLEAGGTVIGMLPPVLVSYEQGEIELQTGDILIGFTDGISEAMNPDDEEWGEDRMIEAIRLATDLSAKEMHDYLVVCADNFAAGAKQHDDMTAIIVRVI